jgi:hypothetical protein
MLSFYFSSFGILITDILLLFLTHAEVRICPIIGATYIMVQVVSFGALMNVGLCELHRTVCQKFCAW